MLEGPRLEIAGPKTCMLKDAIAMQGSSGYALGRAISNRPLANPWISYAAKKPTIPPSISLTGFHVYPGF